jgi:hypothetical protein
MMSSLAALLLSPLLFLQPGPIQLAIPSPAAPAVVDQEIMRANALAMRGDARSLVGKLATVGGVLFLAAGTALLADPSNCKFDEDDRRFAPDLSDRDRCRAVGGVALGIGAIAAGVGGWLWSSGSGMQDEADAIRAGRRTPTGPAPSLSVTPTGARAGMTWRF